MIRLPLAVVFLSLLALSASANDGNVNAAERALSRADAAQAIDYSTRALFRGSLSAIDRARAFEARGIGHLLEGDADVAVADLDSAVQLVPAKREYHLMRGVAYRRTGQYDKAIADYDELLIKMPRDTVGYFAYRNRAAAYLAMGEAEKAIAEYTSWIGRIHYPVSEAYRGRCFSLAVSGKLTEALVDCDVSLRHDYYGNSGALDAKGYVYWKLRQYPQAIKAYDRVLLVVPQHAASLYGRGRAKLAIGDAIGGNKDIEAAKTLDPGVEGTMDRMRNWLEYWIVPDNPDRWPQYNFG